MEPQAGGNCTGNSLQAPLSFLEGLMIEGLQFFMNDLIQLWQGQELLIAQGSQNSGRNHAHQALHKRPCPWDCGPGRKNSGPP